MIRYERSHTLITPAVLALAVLGASSRQAIGVVELTGEEKTAFLERVVSEHAKVRNLWVKIHHSTLEGPRQVQRTLEWAKSYDGKLYTKKLKFTRIGEPESDAYGMGTYDGEHTFLYDSAANNGSIRAGFDRHKEARLGYLVPIYANHFGNSLGSIEELFRPLKSEDWRAELSEDGHDLTLTKLEGLRQSWTFDLTRSAVCKEYATDVLAAAGGIRRASTLTVHEAKEVVPGIWLPVDTEIVSRYKEHGEWITRRTRRRVLQARVNEPEIDKYFSFKWPKGARYYDYTLATDVIPHMTDREMARMLHQAVADLPVELATDVALTDVKPPADDIAVADALVRGELGGGQDSETKAQGRVPVTALVLALVAIVAGGSYLWLRHRHTLRGRRCGSTDEIGS